MPIFSLCKFTCTPFSQRHMKLKSIIFFTILALGTLPLLVLVSINLQNHIHRHEESLQESIAKRTTLTSQAFTEKISKIETDLKRLVTLHESQQLFTSLNNGDSVPLSILDEIEQVINSMLTDYHSINY